MTPAKSAVAVFAVLAVLAAVAGGLVFLGPPAEQRARSLDERRIEDLRGISRATDLYWTRHMRLPESLTALSGEPGTSIVSRDPGTDELYGFQRLGGETYELCGVFERDSSDGQARATGDFWSHGAGRHCFQLTVRTIRR
jgi:hypothetical protein